MPQISLKTDVNNLNKIKFQVKDIYDRFPKTILSDRELIFAWLKEYHHIRPQASFRFVYQYMITNKITLESVTRAGRWWRNQFPEEYTRDKDLMNDKEDSYKTAFRGYYYDGGQPRGHC